LLIVPKCRHTLRRPIAPLVAALLACVSCAAIVAPDASARSTACSPTLEPQGKLVAGESLEIAGTACAPTGILLKRNNDWRLLARTRPDSSGHFSTKVKVRVHKGVKVIELKAVSSNNKISRRVRVVVSASGHGGSEVRPSIGSPGSGSSGSGSPGGRGDSSDFSAIADGTAAGRGNGNGVGKSEPKPKPTPTPEPTPTPSPEPTPTPETSGCPLAATSTQGAVPMTLPGCRLVSSDVSAESNPIPFWSEIACANSSRYSWGTSGGDPQPTATGAPQGNEDYRRTTLFDGDEVFGARCELGRNDSRYGHTTFYHQGEHLVTYFSERLPSNFPLSTNKWQTVMQMKQAQPSDGGGGAPILEMEARGNRWAVVDNWQELWSFPAQIGMWTRFAWDVYYSNNPTEGWLQVSVDLNGDGDFEDPGERSPVFHVATLKTEIEGPNGASDGLLAGQPIPSHLRMGIYHDPSISCPPPNGCSVEMDNVQVVAPE
jgi:hypothetical protein